MTENKYDSLCSKTPMPSAPPQPSPLAAEHVGAREHSPASERGCSLAPVSDIWDQMHQEEEL